METFQYGDYFFTFYTQSANWDEAYTICRATHSRLAIVHTMGRAEFLAHALTEAQMSFEDVWIGGRFLKDMWVWVANGRRIPDKKVKGYPPWVQLPTQRGKNCMALDRKQHDRPLFVELNCRLSRPFICEKSVMQAIDNYPQLGFVSTWGPNQYITYHARVTWDEALAFCRQTGAMLAVIPDLRAANFVMSLMRRSRPGLESVWIGGQYLFDEWVWLSNNTALSSTVGDDGYPPWLYNNTQPGIGKNCLMLDHHSCRQAKIGHKLRNMCEEPVFVDGECSKKKDFICQTVQATHVREEANSTYMGILYLFSSREVSWHQAATDCSLRNMSLAVLDSPQRLRFIITMMSELQDEWDHAWIGGKWSEDRQGWVWASTNHTIPFSVHTDLRGTPRLNSTGHAIYARQDELNEERNIPFPPWCENKYAYEEGSDCLNLDRGDHSIPVFYGLDCEISQGYICQVEEDTDPFVPVPHIRSRDTVVKTKLNFFLAEQACKTNNTFLAVVNTMFEAKRVVAEIEPGDVVWVGAKRENGYWRWKRTGEGIPDVAGPDGYPPWEKLTTDSGAQCLAVTSGPLDWPLFIEKPCSSRLNYICQSPLKSYPAPDLTLTFTDQDYIFYFKNVSWFDASEICAKAGTSLASVMNIHVAKFLLTAVGDNFQALWISGRKLGNTWEWVISGETISPAPENGYPPWSTTLILNKSQQLSCLLLNRSQGPVFEPADCEQNHTFVCVKDEEHDQKADINVYQKQVRFANVVYSVLSKVTTHKKSVAYCLMKGMKLAVISKKAAAMQIMNAIKGMNSFWVDAVLLANGSWVHLETNSQLATDIEFSNMKSDPSTEYKCLVVKNVARPGQAEPQIKMVPAKCNDHAKTVCQKMAEKGTEEKRKENIVAKRGKTWDEAFMICKSLGGHLASSSSWSLIKDFVAELDEDFGNLWIGASFKNGDWFWEQSDMKVSVSELLPGQMELPKEDNLCLLVDRSDPAGLRLSARQCNTSLSYICQEETGGCPSLNTTDSLTWTPSKCSSQDMETGSVCKASCSKHKTELHGPERVVCTDGTWIAKKDLITLPKCLALKEVPHEIHNALDEIIMHQNEVGILFLVDEHRDLTRTDAAKMKRFIQGIVGAYPLGNVRSAGLMVFSSMYRSIIEVTEHNTCYFFEELTTYEPDGTDTRNYMNALLGAEKEVYAAKSRRKGIIILISNGLDEGPANRTSVAERIKSNGVTIMVFGVGAINRNQLEEIASISKGHRLLLFTFKTYEEMQNVAYTFKRNYRKVSPVDCH